MNDTLWRVERLRRGVWVLAASFTLPKGSREEAAILHYRELIPGRIKEPLRAKVVR